MLKNLIYIVASPFTDYYYNRYRIEAYLKKNINVSVWNCTNLLSKELNLVNEKNINKKILNKVKYLDIYDKEVLLNKIRKIGKDTAVLTAFDQNIKNNYIFKELHINYINWGFENMNKYPEGILSYKDRIYIYLLNRIFFLQSLKNFIKKKTTYRYNNYHAKFLLSSGKLDKVSKNFKINSSTKIINVHAYNYDKYLEELKSTDKISGLKKNEYIVYLDENIINHSDWILANMSQPDADKKTFFKQINEVFNFYEKKYNKKIVIAGYLKEAGSKNKNFYNRDVYYGKTPKLVKNAYGVIMHNSTSGHFCVMYKKPVIFLTSKNFSYTFNHSIKAFADSLLSPVVDMSNNKSYKQFSDINKIKYDAFYKMYINSRIPSEYYKFDTNTSDNIIYENLNNLLSKK